MRESTARRTLPDLGGNAGRGVHQSQDSPPSTDKNISKNTKIVKEKIMKQKSNIELILF